MHHLIVTLLEYTVSDSVVNSQTCFFNKVKFFQLVTCWTCSGPYFLLWVEANVHRYPNDAKVVANLTWLQLFHLKLEASWDTVTRWTRLLFPGLPSLNLRRTMEKVACGFSKTAHKDLFVTFTMNLDAIGPYCAGLGIYRSTVADGVPMPSVRLDL